MDIGYFRKTKFMIKFIDQVPPASNKSDTDTGKKKKVSYFMGRPGVYGKLATFITTAAS